MVLFTFLTIYLHFMVLMLLLFIVYANPILFVIILIILCFITTIILAAKINQSIYSHAKDKGGAKNTIISKPTRIKSYTISNDYIKENLRIKKCSKCETKLAEKALFCHKCGRAIYSKIKFCAYCGIEKLKDAIFCHKCGNTLKQPMKLPKEKKENDMKKKSTFLKTCSLCGCKVKPHGKFCSNCGNTL